MKWGCELVKQLFGKLIGVDVLESAQPASDGRIAIGDDVGTLIAMDEEHLGCPSTDATQALERGEDDLIGFVTQSLEVKRSIYCLTSDVMDVLGLLEGCPACFDIGGISLCEGVGTHGIAKSLRQSPLDGRRGLEADELVVD